MPGPFDPVAIGGLQLKNRFVRSATWEGMAGEDGSATPRLAALLRTLARGEVGLVIPGHAYVRPEGQAGPWQLGAHSDAMVPGLASLAQAIHEGGAAACCQLAHAGLRARRELTGLDPVGPSRFDASGHDRGCRVLEEGELQALAGAFGAAARRAREAGFDAVQIHAAHGFLLSQFLSAQFNLREDGYGGPLENRSRLLMEVYAAVRAAVGPGFPVLVKINSNDYLVVNKTAFHDQDMLAVCAALAGAGLDAVELSGGTPDSGKYAPVRMGIIREDREGYYRLPAKWFKERLDLPLILTGGIRSLSKVREFLDSGLCDCVGLSRPLICEPNLVRRWHEGETQPSLCKSENMCSKAARAGEGLLCKLRQVQRRARGAARG
jgi:2,4-dienoyl-CoA reductase-like NADH-dependent reductase (Old Yellow Enzyme family)